MFAIIEYHIFMTFLQSILTLVSRDTLYIDIYVLASMKLNISTMNTYHKVDMQTLFSQCIR